MAITPLPTPPSREDPTNFATRADAFMAALPDFATETNALAVDVTSKQTTASTAATTATTQATTATTQAGIATTQAGIATTKASEALASANAASASEIAASASESASAASEVAAASSAAQAEAAVAGLGFSDVVFINSSNSPYTVNQATSGKLIACDTSSGNIVINLPLVGPLTKPYVVGAKKTTSDSNTITINCSGTDTFDDGSTSKSVNVPAGFTLLPDSDPSPDKWTAIGFGGATAGPATGSGLTMTGPRLLGRQSSGTGALEEISQATLSEMQTGTETALRAMSPLNIAQAIASQVPASDGARFTAVASGSLTNGCMVNLNDDGTVTIVGETTTVYPDSIPSGSAYAFNSSVNFNQGSIAFNKNVANQFMLCYYDIVASRLQAVVGTVSNSTISFGTEVTVDGFVEPTNIDICHVTGTTDRYVMVWRGSGEDGWSIVASVSGTTISLGGAVQFQTQSTYCVALASGPNSGQIAVCCINNNDGNYGYSYAGSVSGTSISWGSASIFESVNCLGPMAISFDPHSGNRLFIMYRPNNTGYGQIRIGSVSGNSISGWTSAYPWFSANELSEDYGFRHYAMAFDRVTANRFVVAWKNVVTNVNQMKAATHNGTSITYGTAVTFNSTNIAGDIGLCMNETVEGSYIISYSSPTATFARPLTVSGTTITLGTEATLQSAASGSTKVVADEGTARKFIGIYKNNTTNVGYAYTGTIGYSVVTNNLSATKFIGISDGSYTNGQTATIQAKYGVNPDQSGLTVNATYYVQTNGSLSTTAASPSVLAGRALSSTKLLIGAI